MKRTGVVTVRPRSPADDGFILHLSGSAFGPYSSTPDRSVAAMMGSRAARTVVAEIGGEPVGFAIVSFEALRKPYGPWARPVLASLDAIAVHESARGTGAGRALMDAVEHLARSQGAISIHLRTATENRRAQALFVASGYRRAAELPGMYRGGQSAFAMMKLLAT
ncbi:MAG: GNAT family N-acetyltransferase [Polyangiaceae bacterium]